MTLFAADVNREANEYARMFNQLAEAEGFDLPMGLIVKLVTLFDHAMSPAAGRSSMSGEQPHVPSAGEPDPPPSALVEAQQVIARLREALREVMMLSRSFDATTIYIPLSEWRAAIAQVDAALAATQEPPQ
jgi:hypothetical protein